MQDAFRYLPITERTVRWGLYLTGCGHVCVSAHGRHPPRGHPGVYQFQWDRGRVLPEYQAIYLVQGKGTFESTPTGRRTIAAGDVLFLFPGVWHRYRPAAGVAWETYWVGLNGSYLQSLLDTGLLCPDSPVLQIGNQPGLVEAYQRLLKLVLDDPAGNPHRFAAGAMETLAWILAPTEVESPQPASRLFAQPLQDRLVAEAVRLIWTNGERSITVSDVVEQFPVTRRSLERRFQRVLGRTIHDEISRCRLERAKQLLVETDEPIKAIALAAGFPSAQHMSRVFRSIEGIAPARYRHDAKKLDS